MAVQAAHRPRYLPIPALLWSLQTVDDTSSHPFPFLPILFSFERDMFRLYRHGGIAGGQTQFELLTLRVMCWKWRNHVQSAAWNLVSPTIFSICMTQMPSLYNLKLSGLRVGTDHTPCPLVHYPAASARIAAPPGSYHMWFRRMQYGAPCSFRTTCQTEGHPHHPQPPTSSTSFTSARERGSGSSQRGSLHVVFAIGLPSHAEKGVVVCLTG